MHKRIYELTLDQESHENKRCPWQVEMSVFVIVISNSLWPLSFSISPSVRGIRLPIVMVLVRRDNNSKVNAKYLTYWCEEAR